MNRKWQPYFKPTDKVHESGFNCFECGYLQLGEGNKAVKKIVIANGVDHIMNTTIQDIANSKKDGIKINIDLLQDGHVRIVSLEKPLYWSIPGSLDAFLTEDEEQACPMYNMLDKMYEE